ncbi:MAG TPA: VOC family protein [Candidatus Dormibacteraeota bacterium]|nr:VOC family protein [Candidatus Dormibacteraeota bacterium]
MLLGIDHVVIACDDLDAAAARMERDLGLRVSEGGRHERLGTENRLVWLGDSYLELIAVTDPSVAATSWLGAPTVAALDRGDGLATYALASDDLAGDLERLRASGARLDGPIDGERVRPDGAVVRWRFALPPKLGPDQPPFLIEHDTTSAEWTPDAREARAADLQLLDAAVRLSGLELPVADVATTQGRYLRSLALLFRPSLAGSGARDVTIGSHTIRLRRARHHELPVIRLDVLAAAGRSLSAELLGCRFELVPAP